MTDTPEIVPAVVAPGQAAYERWHIFQRRRFPGIAPILWDELGAEARAEWENIAQEGASWATHAFAKDEILANAGPEWDKPEVPEATAREYVRHLEAERDRYRRILGEAADRYLEDVGGPDGGLVAIPADDGETPGYWQVRTALTAATHALQLVKLGSDDKLATLAREALAKVDAVMEGGAA